MLVFLLLLPLLLSFFSSFVFVHCAATSHAGAAGTSLRRNGPGQTGINTDNFEVIYHLDKITCRGREGWVLGDERSVLAGENIAGEKDIDLSITIDGYDSQ